MKPGRRRFWTILYPLALIAAVVVVAMNSPSAEQDSTFSEVRGVESAIDKYIRNSRISDQTASFYQDIDFVRSAALQYGQTRGGDYSAISIGGLVDAGLLTQRFGCAGTAATTGAAPAAATAGCDENPFNSAWLVEGISGERAQYRLVIAVDSQLTGRTASDFYETVKTRFWVAPTAAEMSADANAKGSPYTPDVVSVETSKDALSIVFQP